MGGSSIESQKAHIDTFDAWKDHCDHPRLETDLVLLEILRDTHPQYHITQTSPYTCDLLGFAKAGHATATIDDNDARYNASRYYRASPGPRMLKKPGTLVDAVKFGRWLYTWEEKEYILYQADYGASRPHQMSFILSPRDGNETQERYHPATDALLLAVGTWSTALHDEIYVFDNGVWIKDKDLWKSVQDASWDEVILNREMKANLIDDIKGFFNNADLYKKLSVPWKRGIIMHGVPGNGKTISLKAIINSMASLPTPIPSLYVKSFQGSAGVEFSIRNIFDHARIMAPCLLIFEDLDSLVQKNTRSYFLNEVDGLESNDGILMIGSTNHFEKLDPAISKRPSRFDRKYHFKLPSEEERAAYAHYWRRKLIDTDIVYFPGELCPIIAKLTEGFSFAYMKELFVISLLTIARGTVGQAEDISSDDGVVVVRDDTLIEPDCVANDSASDSGSGSDSGDEFEVEHRDKRRPAPPRAKRIVPTVEVPGNLEENALLKALRTQVKVLLDEMDTTDECQWPSSRRGVGSRRGPPRGPPPGMPLPPMHY